MYKFETYALPEIYRAANEDVYGTDTPESIALLRYKKSAREAAKVFDTTMTTEFMRDYLDGKLEVGSLIELSKVVYRTSPSYSKSHDLWLNRLRQLRLVWDYKNQREVREEKFQLLKHDFTELQKLAYSCGE